VRACVYLNKRGGGVECCYKTHKNVPNVDPCMQFSALLEYEGPWAFRPLPLGTEVRDLHAGVSEMLHAFVCTAEVQIVITELSL
jgi:hypothetical protein